MTRGGLWRRAGMDGAIVGLDWQAAVTSLPRGLDRDFALRLLAAAEGSFVPAWLEFYESQLPKST